MGRPPAGEDIGAFEVAWSWTCRLPGVGMDDRGDEGSEPEGEGLD